MTEALLGTPNDALGMAAIRPGLQDRDLLLLAGKRRILRPTAGIQIEN
jgi:hypothetical protein